MHVNASCRTIEISSVATFFTPLFLYSSQVEEIEDELERGGERPPGEGDEFELGHHARYRKAAKLFGEAATVAASVSTSKLDPSDTSARSSEHQFSWLLLVCFECGSSGRKVLG